MVQVGLVNLVGQDVHQIQVVLLCQPLHFHLLNLEDHLVLEDLEILGVPVIQVCQLNLSLLVGLLILVYQVDQVILVHLSHLHDLVDPFLLAGQMYHPVQKALLALMVLFHQENLEVQMAQLALLNLN